MVSVTPGGGGYGDPLTRDVEAVLEDVRERRISAAAALELYGVVLVRGTPELEATARERASRGAHVSADR
jgi:N-methylhydantoinase B